MNWKGQLLHFLVHVGLPTACSLATFVFLVRPGGGRIAAALWRFRWPLFAASRLGYLLVLYGLLRFQGVDDTTYWVDEVRAFPDGDSPSTHRWWALFNVLLIPLMVLGDLALPLASGAGVLLPLLAGDALCLAAGPRLARIVGGDDAERWFGAWLAITPMLWHQVVVRGQNEPLFVGMLAVAAVALLRGRVATGGLLLGLGFAVSKITFVPYALTALLLGTRDLRAFLRGVVPFAAISLAAQVARTQLFGSVPLGETLDKQVGMPPGLGLSLVDSMLLFGIAVPPVAALVLCAAGMTAVVLVVWSRSRHEDPAVRTVAGLAAMHATYMLLSPACLNSYAIQGFLFVLLTMLLWTRASPGWIPLALAALLEWAVAIWWVLPPGWIGLVGLLSQAVSLCVLVVVLRGRHVTPEPPAPDPAASAANAG